MPVDDPTPMSDRQARAAIIAAERLGFEREPELYAAWYDHALHDDAGEAVEHLRSRDPDALRGALAAEEPIAADRAAERITDSGRFTLADADVVIRAATERGFTPAAGGLARLPSNATWDQARSSVAFLWEHHPGDLAELLGDVARIAPLPESARLRGEDLSFHDL
jgi:hypothetical protein